MTFQSQVNTVQAPAVAGDFASANIGYSVDAGPGAFVAAASGVTVGRFAWADANWLTVANAPSTTGAPDGFVVRAQQALIVTFLAEGSVVIPQGLPVTLHSNGDYWVTNATGNTATIKQKVYVSYANGAVSKTGATGAASTNALITANTTSGSAVLTVTANTGAALTVGQPVSGTNIPAGAYIAALGTGTGAAGTYTMSANATGTASGTTVTATTDVETKYLVMSAAASGELMKISSRSLG